MKVLRSEDIAILIMSELARQNDAYISLQFIAAKHGLSALYLKKIAHLLKQHGLVTSREGSSGGYKLAKDPKTVTLLDITKSITQLHEDVNNEVCPLNTQCMPQKIRKTLSQSWETGLSSVHLSEFI